MVTAPLTTPYNRNRIREGWLSLRIPSSRANKLDLCFDLAIGHQSHQREQAKKRWRGPSNRHVESSAWGSNSPSGSRIKTQRIGTGMFREQYQSSVSV